MASPSDRQRQAIRERKLAARRRLQEQHETRQRLQNAAFTELDRLAQLLDATAEELSRTDVDPFRRADQIVGFAAGLHPQVEVIREAAAALCAAGGMTKREVAELLGLDSAALFPRRRRSITASV